MKYLITAFLMALLTGCEEKKEQTIITTGLSRGAFSIHVGGVFKVCSTPSKNPFEPQAWDSVIVTDIQQGYVQYKSFIRKTSLPIRFSRSMDEFAEVVINCTPLNSK